MSKPLFQARTRPKLQLQGKRRHRLPLIWTALRLLRIAKNWLVDVHLSQSEPKIKWGAALSLMLGLNVWNRLPLPLYLGIKILTLWVELFCEQKLYFKFLICPKCVRYVLEWNLWFKNGQKRSLLAWKNFQRLWNSDESSTFESYYWYVRTCQNPP